ncbi:hypothetical protein C4D60_Mb09t20930 [Musa balbisiana]|uniref:MINDY deubiquitinase domain-containing protein n=1 Tax=Musa balbisiana TaxID=52838 RepID=A0A4S8IHW6_MUSBA|nr:hypothetical protein C4D60_Mb09t20930 [Musa balbisiana]
MVLGMFDPGNVLLLRNNLSLSLEASEVSLQKLLSLVAERLIDSNSNVQDKDDGYVTNQRQNISDAIDLLPRLATGIDVNLHFRKINDFEFTRECAIFDLVDIGLYHGWIVDPQDTDTAAAIGSKSYNTLVAELVAFETKRSEGDSRGEEEEDCVDFAAATTATLGVPSPNLSRGRSFDDHQVPVPDDQRKGKGDMQEEEELMMVLNLSRAEVSNPVSASVSSVGGLRDSSLGFDANDKRSCAGNYADTFGEQARDDCNKSNHSDSFALQECNASTDCKGVVFAEDGSVLSNVVAGNDTCQTDHEGSVIYDISNKSEEIDMVMPNQATNFQSPDNGGSDRLFCLQEGLKERELCVFFRNNHFSTMFKFNGELYLLATDQGYMNQPDLVWEKLNEVCSI